MPTWSQLATTGLLDGRPVSRRGVPRQLLPNEVVLESGHVPLRGHVEKRPIAGVMRPGSFDLVASAKLVDAPPGLLAHYPGRVRIHSYYEHLVV
jgi:hypothetical protein